MPTHSIHVITLADAEPEHVDTVREILQEMADLHRQEEGCMRFDVYADAARPGRFNTIEVWESLAAHKRHLNSALVTRSVLMLIGKMRGLPDIRILQPVSEMRD
ncbi:putative quinol monooxygenase [Uliginosibacterium sp. 31-16]|uniref:putative quinol monooxygenase n=1 Tax=Uliginosibacterium sp. 31-16 TaxID=3068315 RepID=UPI00273F63AE|nr:putative quinol monooxygenase [Uliginosibacterium sp. 31-16]MDP5239862.1 putative quinol monooxygenase [Uliginosibacterium sp. 31-16]